MPSSFLGTSFRPREHCSWSGEPAAPPNPQPKKFEEGLVITILAHHELKIENEDDIITVRRRVRKIAETQQFDSFATAAITTATSELARNILVHAKGGEARIEEVSFAESSKDTGVRIGIRIEFRDEGPGIPDVNRVLAGGYSTARSMGLGVSGSRRLVDEFHIESTVGRGTCVTILKWKRF